MPNKLFASMGLSICALVFTILIFIMFLVKKKFSSVGSRIYISLFILTIALLFDEMLYIYAMYAELDGGFIFMNTTTLCYINILGCLLWFALFILYIWALGKKGSNEDYFNQLIVMIALLGVVVIIGFSISYMLPLKYPVSNSNLYSFSGPAVYSLYVMAALSIFLIVFSLIKSGKSIPLHQKKPIYFCLISFILIYVIQIIFDLDYNCLSFIFSYILITLYFTIESQDYKLVDDLEKRREEFLDVDKAQTEFLANMSHEIRTPLNTILGFSDSLLSEEVITKDIINRDVSMIHSASITLLELINNILDISRIQSGKEKIDEKEYKLENILFEINNIVSSKIDKKKNKFKVTIDNKLPTTFYGDSLKLFKSLINLFNNALVYTNYGEISFDVKGIKNQDNLYELIFTISNTGHEMSEENFDIEFNDFVKLGSEKQNTIDSTSLGIIVSKSLINMLGGTIEFINRKGEGTKYIVKIVQKVVDDNQIGDVFSGKDDNKFKKINCSGKKALVVDDNNLNLKLASRLLSNYKFEIDTVKSGKECIELVKNNEYDVIFLDHMMPVMDGLETFEELKKLKKNIPPVIALTANSNPELKSKYIDLGFYEYLAKPISINELNKIINKLFK